MASGPAAWQRVDPADRVRPPKYHRQQPLQQPQGRRLLAGMPPRKTVSSNGPRFCPECGTAQKGPRVAACHGCGRLHRPEARPPKLHWEMHSGRNRFYCNGRCLTAPGLTLFAANLFLTMTIMTLWFVFDAPYLWHEVSPALPILMALLTTFSINSLLAAGGYCNVTGIV